MTRNSLLSSSILILTASACSHEAKPATKPEAQISVNVRTHTTPLADVIVRAKRSGKERQVRTNQEGEALFRFLPEGSEIELFAECPDGFDGPPLQRVIQPARLAPQSGEASRWLLELSCAPLEITVPVAVLSEGCPVDVRLNGEHVGSSVDGSFHHLFKKSRKQELVVSVSPKDDSCLLESSSSTYAADQPAVFARFEARAPKKRTRSARRARRKAPSTRPIRL